MATDEDLQKISQITRDISQGLNTINMINMAENEAISKQKQLEYVQQKKEINEQNKANINTQLSTLALEEKEANDRAKESLKNIRLWNQNAEDLSNLDNEFRTEDGTAVLKDLGLTYDGNFQLSKNIANNVKDQIKINRNYVNIANKMANELSNIEQSFVDLKNEAVENLVDVAGVAGIIDEEDVESYMKADTKGEGGTSRFYDAKGNLTPIGRVFSQPMKRVSGVDIGTWDQKRVQEYEEDVLKAFQVQSANDVKQAVIRLQGSEANNNLKNVNEDYWLQMGSKNNAPGFSTDPSTYVKASFETNRAQKNSLNSDIISSLSWAGVADANKKVGKWISEYKKDGVTLNEQEEIMHNIIKELYPSSGDAVITGKFGAGFKEGSGMEKADYDPSWGWGYIFGDSKAAKVAEENTLSNMNLWMALDNMYPKYQEKYKNFNKEEEETEDIFKVKK